MPEIFVVPPECIKDGEATYSFGYDRKAAEECRDALERANRGVAFYVNDVYSDKTSNCGCNGAYDKKQDWTVEKGLVEGCIEGVGAEYSSWSSEYNKNMAFECARGLNAIERGKRFVCHSIQKVGHVYDTYRVECKNKK